MPKGLAIRPLRDGYELLSPQPVEVVIRIRQIGPPGEVVDRAKSVLGQDVEQPIALLIGGMDVHPDKLVGVSDVAAGSDPRARTEYSGSNALVS